MNIRIRYIAVFINILIFGGIALSMITDLWASETDKIPAKIKEGEFAGEYDPQDIRGSYTFSDISRLFDIDLMILYEAFGIDSTTDGNDIKSKDLESMYADSENEIGNSSVQAFVSIYKGLPMTYEDIYLPESAVDVLMREVSDLSSEQLDYLKNQTFTETNTEVSPTGSSETSTEVSPAESKEEPSVNGNTTFQQLLDLGITKEQIKEVIGADMPPTNQKVKDYCVEKGLSFSEIKTALSGYIN